MLDIGNERKRRSSSATRNYAFWSVSIQNYKWWRKLSFNTEEPGNESLLGNASDLYLGDFSSNLGQNID
jgi:hypothetical protein